MGKVRVSVVNKNELRLDEDGKCGDIIDLNEIKDFDTSFIESLIERGTDQVYAKKLNEEKAHWQAEENARLREAKGEAELERQKLVSANQEVISKLKNEIENLKDSRMVEMNAYKAQTDKEFQAKLNQRENELNAQLTQALNQVKMLEASADNKEALLRAQLEKQYTEEINQLKQEKLQLQQLSENALLKQQMESKDKINALQGQLDNIRLEKSIRGVKVLGEDLESWCNEQYKQASVFGFDHCTWEKDNTTVNDEGETNVRGGTKADYIFRVYLNDEHEKVNELTSVCMDMKNENPNAANKKKNSDYYKKLDDDRRKKGCEYAILVSELEMNEMTDTPIYRVPDYEKMYMVRPQYMITFLSIIYALSKKYSQIISQKRQEEDQFKNKQQLLDEFEQFKETYLNKPLEKMNKGLADILKNSESIRKANESIRDLANELINSTIDTIKSKIDTLSLKLDKPFGNKLDKLS